MLEAANGREALDLILAQRPALVVLDALMPLLSGFDVLTKLREKVPEYKPVVFMVTAVYKSRRWESEARQQHHVQEYLEKPLEEATIWRPWPTSAGGLPSPPHRSASQRISKSANQQPSSPGLLVSGKQVR